MMAAPKYYDNKDFQKWYDFETNTFKDGTPAEVIDMVRKEDAEREAYLAKMEQEGICV